MSVPKDHFITRNGETFAGRHLILDMWGAQHLDSEIVLRDAIEDAARRADATLLSLHLHKFGDGGGVSGVAVLAESHISVHTWPERSYAAFDIFMCGDADPQVAAASLLGDLTPRKAELTEHRRGVVKHDGLP